MKVALLSVFAAAVLIAPTAGTSQTTKPPQDLSFITVQPSGQWLATRFIGQPVSNDAGQSIGNINDLLLDKSGSIVNVVIGVGGFLGIGEKNVAIPFNLLAITADADGKRVVQVGLSRERLEAAPEFKPTEKTVYMRAKEQATDLGRKAADKASDLLVAVAIARQPLSLCSVPHRQSRFEAATAVRSLKLLQATSPYADDCAQPIREY